MNKFIILFILLFTSKFTIVNAQISDANEEEEDVPSISQKDADEEMSDDNVVTGQVYFNAEDKDFYVYDGQDWVSFSKQNHSSRIKTILPKSSNAEDISDAINALPAFKIEEDTQIYLYAGLMHPENPALTAIYTITLKDVKKGNYGVGGAKITSDNVLILGIRSFTDLNFNDNPTIFESGNVGIGHDSPTEKLDILGNVKVEGSQTINKGSLNLVHDESIEAGPELSFKGYRQGWRMGVDVANNGGSGDFVLLARDVPGFGVNDLIYINAGKEGDNSIEDTSGFPTLGFFTTPAFNDVQSIFSNNKLKPNRTTVGIRKAYNTTDNFMLGFFDSADDVVDYGVNNKFEHTPFLKVRGNIEVLSSDINDTPFLRLNANPTDSSTDFLIKNFHNGGRGYELRFLNGSNNFYRYNISRNISTFNHRLNVHDVVKVSSLSKGKLLLGEGAGSGYSGVWMSSYADAPSFNNFSLLMDIGGGDGTILNSPVSQNLTFRLDNKTVGFFDSLKENFNVLNAVSATNFVKTGSTNDDILLGDGTTTSLSALVKSSQTSKPTTVKNGTELFLNDNITGIIYNKQQPSKDVEFSTASGIITGGYAVVYIDTASATDFPKVKGATQRTGAPFESNTIYKMIVYSDDGSTVDYYFIKY